MPAPDPDTLAALLAPVPGDAPAGRDLRYDPRYDAVREARREDAELPQGGLATERKVADWAQVQQATATLLARESKDLNLAVWHAEARLKRAGLSGLASGLTVIQGLLDQYWDALFPELEEGDAELRLGPLEWVGSRLDLVVHQVPVAQGGLTFAQHRDSRTVPTDGEAGADSDRRKLREERLREGKVAPEAADAAITATPKAFYKGLVADATAALAALDALEHTSEARFPDDPPSYRALRLALDEVHRFATTTLAQKLEADPDPVEAVLGDDGDDTLGTAGNGAAPAAGGALAPEPVDRNDAAARVAAAARFLRQQDATAPAPYLLLRGLRWGEVRSVTGQLDPRLLDAPAPAVRTRLKTLLLDGKWPELLEQGELAMATPAGRGWLDLQRYVLTACARLGPSYDAVATAVRTELAAYLAAVPQLLETTLMDDTPTANAETLHWLAAEGLDPSTPAPEENATDDDADSELPDGSAALVAALDGELAGDTLAAAVRGSAARRTTGRRRADRLHAAARNGDGADGVDPFTLAKAELARGRTNRAVELLAAELERERSARGRFVRETQMAQIMVEAGLAEVAQPILQRLVELIEAKSLADWEAGPLVAQPLVLLCRVIDALDSGSRERDELYLKVCRLDPLQAIALRRPA